MHNFNFAFRSGGAGNEAIQQCLYFGGLLYTSGGCVLGLLSMGGRAAPIGHNFERSKLYWAWTTMRAYYEWRGLSMSI